VHPRPGTKAKLVLLEARKTARPDLTIAAPLTLHPDARGPEFSPEALTFCPWLEK
jgi:tRNA1(Val) A37 N6-methylase TrmN6